MTRESWHSRLGFVMAAVGSAVGLANIWRFPYVVGENGGGAFIALYLFFLFVIGFPVFLSEILLGRSTQMGAAGSFRALTGLRRWSVVGKGIVGIGFVVSSLYSVLAGWILGYLFEALRGGLSALTSVEASRQAFEGWVGSSAWCLTFHFLFMALAVFVLVWGVRRGIERGNKILMPVLLGILVLLAVRGLTLPGASKALHFIFRPDFSQMSATAVLVALGQAFFTLSLGQGTMITYGSYLRGGENLVTTCLPVALFDTLISIIASVAVLAVVFSTGLPSDTGVGLLFMTLPTIFSTLPGGHLMSLGFFISVALAALTSQISAMEPLVNYFILEKKWSRRKAVLTVGLSAFALGVPSALSFGVLKNVRLADWTFFQWTDFLAIDVAIPVGGFIAILFVGWVWGLDRAMVYMRSGMESFLERNSWYEPTFRFLVRYLCPLLILFVFLSKVGLFGLLGWSAG